MNKMPRDCYLPRSARIVARQQESDDIFTLSVQFDEAFDDINPGQFNMLYALGVGEVAISIVNNKPENNVLTHTIRRVGQVTEALSRLKVGDELGVRGPFGLGWPVSLLTGRDILIITGGLGCAPSVSLIEHIMTQREQFGELFILQGVKHSNDILFREQYEQWASVPRTTVRIAADIITPEFSGFRGYVTALIDQIDLNISNTIALMCGPEAMMINAVKRLLALQMSEQQFYLNIERNMECAVGHCGHCQMGGSFVCKEGPVFCYPDIKLWLGRKGF